jgi:hypothetical protein
MKMLSQVNLPVNHPFVNNKYTMWYYSIITHAQHRTLLFDYCEKHHIIPDCFYITNRSKGKKPGWLLGNPDDPNNIVELTVREHIVCHWLLTKMVKNIAQSKQMEKALSIFVANGTNQCRKLSPLEATRIIESKKSSTIGQRLYNNGVHQTWSHEHPGEGWELGALPEFSNKMSRIGREVQNRPEVKAKHATTNALPEVKARKSQSKKIAMNRPDVVAKVSVSSKESQNRPDVKRKKSQAIKQLYADPEYAAKCYAGSQSEEARAKRKATVSTPEFKKKKGEILSKAVGNPEVQARRVAKVIGSKWWNNGVINKRCRERPDGFVAGRLK